MEAFAYKGISDGKYVEGDIEALNLDEASHKLKEQKIIITNLVRTSKKKKETKRYENRTKTERKRTKETDQKQTQSTHLNRCPLAIRSQL